MQTAQGYATARVNRALGETKRYLAVQAEYERAPKVTRARLYLGSSQLDVGGVVYVWSSEVSAAREGMGRSDPYHSAP